MAKPIKKAAPVKPIKANKFTKHSLVALSDAAASSVGIQVDFTSGLGQLTAVLFRNGVLINMQSISTSGVIQFSEVQSRDTISINGVCAGDATVTVSVPTNPSTPENFSKQIIISGYIIL